MPRTVRTSPDGARLDGALEPRGSTRRALAQVRAPTDRVAQGPWSRIGHGSLRAAFFDGVGEGASRFRDSFVSAPHRVLGFVGPRDDSSGQLVEVLLLHRRRQPAATP